MKEKLAELIRGFEGISATDASLLPISFQPPSAAFESVRAAEIFAGKRPADFEIDWIFGKEDILFFLPKPVFATLLPFFILEVLREARGRGNIVRTSELAGILADLDIFDHPCVFSVVNNNKEIFREFFIELLNSGFVTENDMSRLNALL